MSRLVDLIGALARAPGALRRRSAERRHRALMARAPRYRLADLPENTFGRIVGIARPERKLLLEAPLSGRLCIYYDVAIDAMSGDTMLRTLATEQEGLAFVLADGDARALVDPANAFMSTGIDHVSTSTLGLASDRQQALLDRHRLSGLAKRATFADGLRYREAIIEADERIAVYGAGVREPDPDADPGAYRDSRPMRLRFTGTRRFPLFISDDPRVHD